VPAGGKKSVDLLKRAEEVVKPTNTSNFLLLEGEKNHALMGGVG